MTYPKTIGDDSTLPLDGGHMSRRLLLASGLAAGVTACSGPSDLIGVESTRPLTEEEIASRGHRIYIATSRRRSEVEGEFYGGERNPFLSFAAVDVVIPPNHVTGNVERPRSLPVNPDEHFVITNPREFSSREEVRSVLSKDVLTRPRGQREAMLWIHGYNTNLTLAVLRAAQFVEDTGYKGVLFLYSWASQAKLTGYVYDINSALIARDFLESIPDALKGFPNRSGRCRRAFNGQFPSYGSYSGYDPATRRTRHIWQVPEYYLGVTGH